MNKEDYPFNSNNCPACYIPELYIDHAFEPQLGSAIMEEEDVVDVEVEASKKTMDTCAMDAEDSKQPGVSTPAAKKPCRVKPNKLSSSKRKSQFNEKLMEERANMEGKDECTLDGYLVVEDLLVHRTSTSGNAMQLVIKPQVKRD
jgi:hypothetical protein